MEFTIETRIERPPDEVFAVVTDPGRLPQWQPLVVEVEVLGGGPVRQGSRIREVREVRGRRLEQLVEVAVHEPPRRFAMRIVEGPFPIDGDLTFAPASGGAATVVRLRAHGRLTGPMRLAAPLLAIGGRREMRRQYAALKRLLERDG